MAPVVPILAGIGAGTAATALGATAAVSTGVGIATGVATASALNRSSRASVQAPPAAQVPTAETDTSPVDTSGATGGADTTINDVTAVQEDVAEQADTTVQQPVTEEDVGTTVQTGAGSGTITSVNEATQEAQVDVAPGTTTSGGVQTGGTFSTSSGTSGGGTAEAVVARTQSVGPAEDKAIDFYEKGRRSTILTGSQGLLAKTADSGTFRRRRTLVGGGLIA